MKTNRSEVIFRFNSRADNTAYRVTSDGVKARLFRCRANGVWRLMKEMPLKEYFIWADSVGFRDGEERLGQLLKELAEGVPSLLYQKE